jgi:hypothetical protein
MTDQAAEQSTLPFPSTPKGFGDNGKRQGRIMYHTMN